MIPFNRPYICGKEATYISDVMKDRKLSGNGPFTKKVHQFFEKKWHFKKAFLTTSCTDALEMCALLLGIGTGDEIIMPSYTFVSTALAFVRQGARIIFVDSRPDNPNIDENKIEQLITPKTKAIVVVHYAGIACQMDKIMDLAKKNNIYVIEDAAQAINSYFNDLPLGSIGHLATFSFHETKNVQCGEGGLLTINDESLVGRAEIIWEKGTDRAKFFRGEIEKYGWVDIGSSFLPSDILAAFLFAQLENLEDIQNKRLEIWNIYKQELNGLLKEQKIVLPFIPQYAFNNAHMFYIVLPNFQIRKKLIKYLQKNNIHSVFHYQSLHNSKYFRTQYQGDELIHADRYTNCLLRLPLFYELSMKETHMIADKIVTFYEEL